MLNTQEIEKQGMNRLWIKYKLRYMFGVKSDWEYVPYCYTLHGHNIHKIIKQNMRYGDPGEVCEYVVVTEAMLVQQDKDVIIRDCINKIELNIVENTVLIDIAQALSR